MNCLLPASGECSLCGFPRLMLFLVFLRSLHRAIRHIEETSWIIGPQGDLFLEYKSFKHQNRIHLSNLTSSRFDINCIYKIKFFKTSFYLNIVISLFFLVLLRWTYSNHSKRVNLINCRYPLWELKTQTCYQTFPFTFSLYNVCLTWEGARRLGQT